MNQETLFLSYYGDDFTGSTDVMEALHFHGVPTALFLEPPAPVALRDFRLKSTGGPVEAVGVAGIGRSLSPAGMEAELPPLFERMSRLPARFFHYKICSTFDSSPEVGNIGTATDIALRYFPSDYVPLVVGAPMLKRYVLFGNLFARVAGETFRLDRHPTMSKHPVTPMRESDLRRHLAAQTSRPARLLDLFALEAPAAERRARFEALTAGQADHPFILFDTYHDQHLKAIGELLWGAGDQDRQLLVGSSGAEYALMAHLRRTGRLGAPIPPRPPGPAEQLIAVAGSAAPATRDQIRHVLGLGFAGVAIEAADLVDAGGRAAVEERLYEECLQYLRAGRSLVAYSALGPDDPAIGRMRRRMQEAQVKESISKILGGAQGRLLRRLLAATGLRRVVVAGGDTSGYVARTLGIRALESLTPIAPGSPLCLAHAADPLIDGLEIALKGGQVGDHRYFEAIQEGRKLED